MSGPDVFAPEVPRVSADDAERGVRRPVYVHESTHAVVARDLRLLTGNAKHSPLQEGIATYVQLCLHPDSVDRGAFALDEPLIEPRGLPAAEDCQQHFHDARLRIGGRARVPGHREQRCLRLALDAIGEIAGRVETEELLGEIFGRFCIGK